MTIDELAIIEAVSQLPLEGDDIGMISAFGVYLTHMFSDYYCETSYKFEEKFKETAPVEVQEAAKQLLIESGHVCGFNTFGGIMKSDEWNAVVRPMVQDQDDCLRGMVAVINTLGWGKYSITEFNSAQKLVLDIQNSYESEYYTKHYGTNAESGKCYLAIGATVAMMNLVYVGDIMNGPELDDDFYNMLFLNNREYVSEEILCRSKGDEVCRIQITKSD